jgi:adenosylmethionine-8-amino-7-oxononanoate aminotransferase
MVNEEHEVLDRDPHALWHGVVPMGRVHVPGWDDLLLVRGQGSHVYDVAGRSYVDARSSMWNVTLGYSCEPVKEAMRRQLGLLPFAALMRFDQPAKISEEYANRLAEVLPRGIGRIRFANTGTQATETAVMLSRFSRRVRGEAGRTAVVCLDMSYHGSGPLATALTGEDILHELCAPLTPDVYHVPPPFCQQCPWGLKYPGCGLRCADAVIEKLDALGPERVTAVMVEPVLGTSTIVPPPEYLPRVRQACVERGIHLILDEITTCAGRVGAMTVTESLPFVPDMVVLGKGLSTGYFPLAAIAVSEELYELFYRPQWGYAFPIASTTDGHPVGMAAGIAVLDVIMEPGFLDAVRHRGERLRWLLGQLIPSNENIAGVRGIGMMIAVDLIDQEGRPWTAKAVDNLRIACQKHGMLTTFSPGSMPIMSPINATESDCLEMVEILNAAINAISPQSVARSSSGA